MGWTASRRRQAAGAGRTRTRGGEATKTTKLDRTRRDWVAGCVESAMRIPQSLPHQALRPGPTLADPMPSRGRCRLDPCSVPARSVPDLGDRSGADLRSFCQGGVLAHERNKVCSASSFQPI